MLSQCKSKFDFTIKIVNSTAKKKKKNKKKKKKKKKLH